MTTILACIDGSRYTASVCEHTAWAATRTGASVELLHVHDQHTTAEAEFDLSGSLGADDQESLLEQLTALDEERGRLAQRRGRLILDEATSRISAAGVSDITSRQRQGVFVDVVTELETGAELVVLGKRGETKSVRSPHLGGNLERVVRASSKPVLVASREFRPIKRFLIAFDGGESVRNAIEHISRSALLKEAECRLLMVGADDSANRRLVDAATEILRMAGIAVDAAITPGRPEDVIADDVEAENIDLIVMGAYGHSRIRRLIIGSTTTTTLQRCRVPVLMFRT